MEDDVSDVYPTAASVLLVCEEGFLKLADVVSF